MPTPPKEEPRCWRCGGQLGLTAKFCGDCGAPREVPEAAKPKETASQKSVKVGCRWRCGHGLGPVAAGP